MDTFQINRIIFFRWYGHFSDKPDNFQMIWTLFRSPGYILDSQDTFQLIRVPFIWYGHFSEKPDNFQLVWTIFRSPAYILDRQDTLQIIPTIFAKFSFSATIHWSPSFDSDKTKRALFIQPTKLPRTSDFWMDQTFRCKFWNGSKHCRFWTSPRFQRLLLCSFVRK